MNTEELTKTLLATTYTKAQSLRRLRLIQDFLNFWVFTPHDQAESTQKISEFIANETNITPADQQWALQFFTDFVPRIGNLSDQLHRNQVLSTLQQAEENLAKTEILKLYIPFDMPGDQILRLGQWVKTNISPLVLMELHFNGELLAGCAMSWKGVYRDYSLGGQIAQNRAEILQSLTSFKR